MVRQVAQMSKTCITRQSVRRIGWHGRHLSLSTAKKEDNPEAALKEFKAIVDQESEKGDWLVHSNACSCSIS